MAITISSTGYNYFTVEMKSTVKFVNSSHRIHPNLHMPVAGYCCHCVLDASLLLKRLLHNVNCAVNLV